MTSLLLPAVVIIFAIFSLIFLWWVSYPFLLRYSIESASPTLLSTATSSNGNNGLNGTNGANSPETTNGIHGQPGLDSPPGLHGKNGLSGRNGNVGITGHDGDVGGSGTEGLDGVPGFNVIPVRGNLFDPNSKTIYYVNGVPFTDHINGLSVKAATSFAMEKARAVKRIDAAVTLYADKVKFKSALSATTAMDTPSNPYITVLDNVNKMNTFLDSLASTYTAAKTLNENVKTSNITTIDISNSSIDSLRAKRDLDYLKLDTSIAKKAVRTEIFNAFRISNTVVVGSVLDLAFIALQADDTITFDSKIRDITMNIRTPTRVFNSIDPAVTPAMKETARLLIIELTFYINSLKSIKEEIIVRRNSDRSLILDWYSYGDNHSPNINSLTLETYNTGANYLKGLISTATGNIAASQTTYDSTINSFLSPYRAVN